MGAACFRHLLAAGVEQITSGKAATFPVNYTLEKSGNLRPAWGGATDS